MKKKIIVTGGSGFIGTNLVNYLNKLNYEILNIDKISYCSVKEKFKNITYKHNYKFIKLNLKNDKKLFRVISKFNPKYIINLASESHVDRSIDNPDKFIKENIDLTIGLLEVLKKVKIKKKINTIKLIHISTDEVFGSISKKFANEDATFNPSSAYSASKAAAENIINSYYKTFKINFSTLRLCNNYGPYQFTEKFIPTIIMNIYKNKKIPLYGKGEHVREWMHVDDTCAIIEKNLHKFKNGESYNIGSNIYYKNIDLIFLILKFFYIKHNQIKKILFTLDRPGHDLRYAMNSKKFKKLSKWKNFISMKKGLEETIKWYKNNSEWIKSTRQKYDGKRLGIIK